MPHLICRQVESLVPGDTYTWGEWRTVTENGLGPYGVRRLSYQGSHGGGVHDLFGNEWVQVRACDR